MSNKTSISQSLVTTGGIVISFFVGLLIGFFYCLFSIAFIPVGN